MKQLLLVFVSLVCLAAANAQKQQAVIVYFSVDKYAITNTAATSVDSFLAAGNLMARVKLSGYCDISAGFAYNDALSLKRVSAVKEYLISKGFDATNISAEKAYGKRKLLNSNSNEQERSLNRRVEIVFSDTGAVAGIKQELQTMTLTEQITDTQLTAGKNIILQNLNFYGGTHRILPASMPVLQELLAVLRNNPFLEIAIEGHVCCTDGPGDGLDIETTTNNLSENRAREIYNYLLRNGVASSRLRYRGYGHRFPLSSSVETTEEERIANRRVEIQILNR